MTLTTPRNARDAGTAVIRDPLRLAAIDVGSNSIHMIVAHADADGGLTTLWRMKEPVGLGRISFPSNRLSREAIDRAIRAMGRFKQAAMQRQCETICAVATSAVREAENGGDLIERCRRQLRLTIRVVSAREEARLIYLAARHATPLKKSPHLIVDIGGGSVELIVGDENRAMMLESRKLGAARMTAKFVKSDPIDEASLKALRKHYEKELTPVCEQILALKPVKMLGTSGTLENLASMCSDEPAVNGNGAQPRVIERDRFDKLLHKLLGSNAKERENIRGLDDQRRDQIIAGAVLVDELFKLTKFKRIELCKSALREGILLDYLSRHIPDLAIRREVPDPRRRSVIDLARRCDWHKTHSEHVAALTMQLFDDLKWAHGLGAVERELIEYAALLHDIGWHIGGSEHHKHSRYLILNGDLKNFTDEEIKIIANISRYHRKSVPKGKHESYSELSSAAKKVVNAGAALLRIADGLDRSHALAVKSVQCRKDGDKVKCTLHTRSDAQLEIWGARRKRDLFEKTFRHEISFSIAKN